jgi:hypothetical protein
MICLEKFEEYKQGYARMPSSPFFDAIALPG